MEKKCSVENCSVFKYKLLAYIEILAVFFANHHQNSGCKNVSDV